MQAIVLTPRRSSPGSISRLGSSVGLMLMQAALGIMSLTWMVLVALIILAQKLLPPRAAIDVPLAVAIIGFGVLIIAAPSLVPGLTPGM